MEKKTAIIEKEKETKNTIMYRTESDLFGPGKCLYIAKSATGEGDDAPDRIKVTLEDV